MRDSIRNAAGVARGERFGSSHTHTGARAARCDHVLGDVRQANRDRLRDSLFPVRALGPARGRVSVADEPVPRTSYANRGRSARCVRGSLS